MSKSLNLPYLKLTQLNQAAWSKPDPFFDQKNFKVLCDLQSGKLEWTFMHEDVPLENKIITTVDQLPSCPRKKTYAIPQVEVPNSYPNFTKIHLQEVSVLS